MMFNQKEYDQQWEREHRAERNRYQREKYAQNKERWAAYAKKARAKAPGKIAADKRKYYLANREKMVKRSRDWYLANREKALERVRIRNRVLVGTVGATGEIRHGICPICEKTKKLVCDHDHVTGAIRGWVCNWCNMQMERTRKYEKQFKAYMAAYRKRIADG